MGRRHVELVGCKSGRLVGGTWGSLNVVDLLVLGELVGQQTGLAAEDNGHCQGTLHEDMDVGEAGVLWEVLLWDEGSTKLEILDDVAVPLCAVV